MAVHSNKFKVSKLIMIYFIFFYNRACALMCENSALKCVFENFIPIEKNNEQRLSSKCQEGISDWMNGIKNNEIWALKMIDASAKLPSGILRGNINQYGDFDECLSLNEAKYCLTDVDLSKFWEHGNSNLQNLVHSHFAFNGNISDASHRVPNFSIVKWGLCFPKGCTTEDLQKWLNNTCGIQFVIQESMCQVANNEKSFTFGDYFARIFFFSLALLVITSTLVEYLLSSLNINYNGNLFKILKCFALQRNWKKMFVIKNDETESKNTIGGVDGIRALSALGLLMSHKSIAMLYNPFINRTDAAQNLGKSWSVIGRTAIIYTDSFMLISGLLNSKPLFDELEAKKTFNFKVRILNRIFRILPSLVAVILFCTYILPNLGSGPLWPRVIEHHSTLCKRNMWRNFLFIHNYFGFENMCLTHTHQLGIDFQLYLITPILVHLFGRNPIKGLTTILVLILASTILRFWITMQYQLSHVVYFGVSIKRMFETANLSYILPTHRASIYLMGMLLAYVMNVCKKNYKFSLFQLIPFWTSALSLGLLAMFGPYHMAKIGYQYNVLDAAIYGSLSPIAWGLCLIWGIIVSDMGYGGWLGSLLCWKGFKFFSTISYAVYLVQFPVFFYFVGIQRTSTEHKFYHLLHLSEILIILCLSVLLTLMVEMPFQQLGQFLVKALGDENKSKFSPLKSKEESKSNLERKIKSG